MIFDHIGIVVPDLAAGRRLLGDAFAIAEWTEEFSDPVNDVWVQFGRCPAGVCYETIAPLSPASPVSRVLARRINTVNHVAYLTDDLAREAARLAPTEFVPTGAPQPAVAYGGRRIQFFVSPGGMMFELIEAPGHLHRYATLPPAGSPGGNSL